MAESVAEAICSFRNWALAIALRAPPRSQPLGIAEVCRKSLPGIVPPEDLPGSRLFEEFCGDTIKRWQLGDRVIKAKVIRIQPKSGRFRLWFEDGKSAIARRVIVVAGSGKPHLPGWTNQIQTQNPTERIRHSHQVDLRNLLHGEQILIVGGGLTSGHLVVEAIVREAQVLLRTRRYLANYFFTRG
jgi:thioredoxin reductase